MQQSSLERLFLCGRLGADIMKWMVVALVSLQLLEAAVVK